MIPSELDPEFWQNRFHTCALVAGFLATRDGRLHDAGYVRQIAYQLYESGAYRAANLAAPSQTVMPVTIDLSASKARAQSCTIPRHILALELG
jgi:hypothetical protein